MRMNVQHTRWNTIHPFRIDTWYVTRYEELATTRPDGASHEKNEASSI
jgi:hypothetical protein